MATAWALDRAQSGRLRGPNRIDEMSDGASTDSLPARLAEIREQMKLLADYL
jgi:hypothetical protein